MMSEIEKLKKKIKKEVNRIEKASIDVTDFGNGKKTGFKNVFRWIDEIEDDCREEDNALETLREQGKKLPDKPVKEIKKDIREKMERELNTERDDKPKTLTRTELAEEVAEIDSEAFDLIDEMVDEDENEDICPECGFPRGAEREPVFTHSSFLNIVMYLENCCDTCGHQKDGSTIKDDEIYEKYAKEAE